MNLCSNLQNLPGPQKFLATRLLWELIGFQMEKLSLIENFQKQPSNKLLWKGVLKICTDLQENIHAELWFQWSCFATLKLYLLRRTKPTLTLKN